MTRGQPPLAGDEAPPPPIPHGWNNAGPACGNLHVYTKVPVKSLILAVAVDHAIVHEYHYRVQAQIHQCMHAHVARFRIGGIYTRDKSSENPIV